MPKGSYKKVQQRKIHHQKIKRGMHPFHAPLVIRSNGHAYLHEHDEEKLVLFVTGLVFGIGLTSLAFGSMWYMGFVALAMASILLFLEGRQR